MNLYLLVLFLLYIATLLIGFAIDKKNKDELNKKYLKSRQYLNLLIYSIFIYSVVVIAWAAIYLWWLYILLGINLIITIYFSFMFSKKDRCYKQHRMILYNFFLIVILYFCALVIMNPYLNLFALVIYAYNVYEFRYAIFNAKKSFLWD